MYMYILYIYVHIYACMGVCVSICISLKREKPRCNISLLLQQCYIKSSHKTQWFTTKKTIHLWAELLLGSSELCVTLLGWGGFGWVQLGLPMGCRSHSGLIHIYSHILFEDSGWRSKCYSRYKTLKEEGRFSRRLCVHPKYLLN